MGRIAFSLILRCDRRASCPRRRGGFETSRARGRRGICSMLLTEINVRDQRKSVHRHGTVLGPLADWPTEGNATRRRGQCLAKVRHGGVRNRVGLGRHFLHEHVRSASTWRSPRMKTLREHPRCGEISGKRGAQGKEMRSSNRPTRYLSSAELLGPAGQCRGAQIPCVLLP